LHAAVNKGNLELVDIILQSLNNEIESDNNNNSEASSTIIGAKKIFKLDINKINEKCMDSTALHLACWNDFNEIAIRLVQSKADPNLKMNKASNAFDLALENSNQILYELLKEYS
jgi:ankyrin repeat protein